MEREREMAEPVNELPEGCSDLKMDTSMQSVSEWGTNVLRKSKTTLSVPSLVKDHVEKSRERVSSMTDEVLTHLNEKYERLREGAISDETWRKMNARYREIRDMHKTMTEEAWSKLHEDFDDIISLQQTADDAWARITEEFEKLKSFQEKTVARFDTERLRLKGKARSVCRDWSFYATVIVTVGPILGGLYIAFSANPSLFLGFIVYMVFIVLLLLWSLVVPSIRHRGTRYFGKHVLSYQEDDEINRLIASAEKRIKTKKHQKLWDEQDKAKPLFILSFDGGGIKGMATARIVSRISHEFPDFLDRVGLIAGCSTGSIVGGMLATGFSADEVCDLFRVGSPVIFRTTLFEQLKHLGGFVGPNHDGEGKYEMLSRAFRGKRLHELDKGLLVTASHVNEDSFMDNHCMPRVWSNVVSHAQQAYVGHHELEDDTPSDALDRHVLDMKLADVVNGATAAPLYFPAHQSHVDAALWNNNPSMAALAHVSSIRDINQVSMLSISTGLHVPDEKCRMGTWGLRQWLPWLLDFLFNSTATAAHLNVRAMLRERYHRLEPILPRPIALNDVNALDECIEVAENLDLEPTFAFLESQGFTRVKRADRKEKCE